MLPWGKLSKWYIGSLCIISYCVHTNLLLPQNKKVTVFSFVKEEEIKTFSEIQKLKELIISIPTIQEMLQHILQEKVK